MITKLIPDLTFFFSIATEEFMHHKPERNSTKSAGVVFGALASLVSSLKIYDYSFWSKRRLIRRLGSSELYLCLYTAGLQKTYIGGYAIILFWLTKISLPLQLSKYTI